MVAIQSLEKTVAALVKPYQEALGLSLPVQWETNDEGKITVLAGRGNSPHRVSIDPDVNKFRFAYSPLPFPCGYGDYEIVDTTVEGLCELHVAEKVDPVTSMPWHMEGGEVARDFSFFHGHTVSIWNDDVMYQRWPDILKRSCQEQNRQLGMKIDELLGGQISPLGMMIMVYSLGQINATMRRHEVSLDGDTDTLTYLYEHASRIGRLTEQFVDVWEDMPTLTYKRKRDLRNYEATVKRVAKVARFTGKSHLAHNSWMGYNWVIE